MSWTLTVPSVAKDKFDEATSAALATYETNLQSGDYDLDQFALAQVNEAIASAKAIVESGAVGDGPFNLTLSGHANPDHKPVKGWANDVVTVSVYNAAPIPTV